MFSLVLVLLSVLELSLVLMFPLALVFPSDPVLLLALALLLVLGLPLVLVPQVSLFIRDLAVHGVDGHYLPGGHHLHQPGPV